MNDLYYSYKMNWINIMFKIIGLVVVIYILVPTYLLAAEKRNLSEGIWFRCEFAHSQIPPDDKCKMLDDDGFQMINGSVYHVKVTNSLETKCRHERIGNCFSKSQKGLQAELTEIGPIKVARNKVDVTWLGCMQNYVLTQHSHYIEVAPNVEVCWWTPNKRYFIARYPGEIKITDGD
jgi:hypothetical protein